MSTQAELPEAEPAPSLREYLAILRVRKWSVILIALLVIGSALAFSFLQTPLFTSTARVLVDPPSLALEVASQVPNLETERELVASAAVAEVVAEDVGYQGAPDELLRGLTVNVPPSTEILEIEYEHHDPIEAKRLAQGFASGYLDFRRQQALDDLLAASASVQARLEELEAQLQDINTRLAGNPAESERATLEAEATTMAGQVALLRQQLSELSPPAQLRVGEVVQPADLPSEPSSPNHLLNGALAIVLGLALGIGLAFLRERLDDRLRGRADLEQRAGVPVLAVIPRVASWRKKSRTPTVALDEPRSAAAEAYRTLRTGVVFAASQRQIRTILITSPHEGDGKTATTANLGVALAHAGKRVILVSADLRRPRLERFFGADKGHGLTNVIAGEMSLDEVTANPGIDGIRIVPTGPIPGNPAELLGSDAMGGILDQLKESADLVLIDAPPLLAVADSLTLASMVDGVLLVVDAEETTRAAVMHARRELEQVDAPVIGAILNRFDASRSSAYPYYYQYYYRYEPDGGGRRGGRAGRG